ncbi:MAG: thiamine pyrophosphate-dependent enzyme [Desulfobacterota bacterium]|nr:thiamine pyrophosphate-dependent enzyme [Thermodesulfobacteriota bacterium]
MGFEERGKRTNLKELSRQPERLAPGHRMCSGCAEAVIVRQILHAIEEPVVVATPTGCLEITTAIFPYTAWRVPWIHSAFETAASIISGVEAAYRSLKRQGKIDDRVIRFVVFAGDGATYDIGFQWLSGALERGHRFLYVCLNNEAYMNTGTQRSGATPKAAWSTTTPVGKAMAGKIQHRKDMTAIVAAHNIPYVAQAAPHAWQDLMRKVKKGISADGPAFLNVLSPCPRGWRYDPKDLNRLSRLAVETCVWPLYEVEEGEWRLNYQPKTKRPLTDWFASQGRFSHLLSPGYEDLVAALQSQVDLDWARLQRRCRQEGLEEEPTPSYPREPFATSLTMEIEPSGPN